MQTRLFQSDSFRHAAVYTALFVSSMAVLIALVYVIMDQAFQTELLRASNDDLQSIHKAYVGGAPLGRGAHEAKEMIDDRMLAPDDNDRFLLQASPGIRLAGNLPVMTPRNGTFHLHISASPGTGSAGGHDILGRGMVLSPALYAFVGRDMAPARQTEAWILRAFAGVLLGSLVLASLSGLFLSRIFLRRVDAISDTCRSIMSGQLSDRISTGGKRSELERLAVTINGMLDRIQVLMESLRQISNDIAHDLRTPLTHLRHNLEKAKDEAESVEAYAAGVDAAIADADELLGMFNALLRIAQIESGARREGFANIDLGQVLGRAHDIYCPLAELDGRTFDVCVTSPAEVFGDRQLLLQLVANLLDNAIHHTPPGTPISASVTRVAGRPAIVICDRGPGIPEAYRERVFRRFYRLEASRTSRGSGLGLALVAAIAEMHDAEIVLQDNAPGLGVSVVFRFPAE